MGQRSNASLFFPTLFAVFAIIGFVLTWLFGPFGALATAVGSGYFMGLMGGSGGQTVGLFMTPLSGSLLGISIALPFGVFAIPGFSRIWALALLVCLVGYIAGHVLGLATFRKSRIPGL